MLCTQAQARKAYTEVPTLVHLAKSEQEDTFGFNLVESLPPLFYKYINEGKLTLWDSPKKQVAISSKALKDIESNNHISFSKVENLFLNELWTSSRRRTEFVIIGFSFLSESQGKGKVSLGYVDAAEAYGILMNTMVPTNPNGPAQINYIDALYSMRYNFNLLQFGSKDFTINPAQSFVLKRDAFYSKKKVMGLVKMPLTKMITYTIEKNPGVTDDPGANCFNTIEKYINDNKEVLLEIGGDRYFDFMKQIPDITVTRVEITEIWEKKGSQIMYKPYQVRIFVNNKPLDPIPFDEISKWELLMSFKTLGDVLSEKAFNFTIYKCNNDLVAPDEAPIYLKALKDYKWTQVTYYVKYSKNQ